MLEVDWRCAQAYEAVDDLSAEALAWEFLRRNPAYQADYVEFLEESAAGAEAVAEGARFARWGLTFRRRSWVARTRPAGVLAA